MTKRNRHGRGGLSSKQKDFIMERDRHTCVYCGQPATVIDHVVPVIKGGITDRNNLVASCNHCNMKKCGGLNLRYITRGLYWLQTKGENTDWVDRVGLK